MKILFQKLAEAFDGPESIETHARDILLATAAKAVNAVEPFDLPRPFLDIMSEPNAHPVCQQIAQTPFDWSPPQTSTDPVYIEHSLSKVHVELVGPDGLVKSNEIRIGLYGMLPNSEYGVRTHPAEETFIMLAGQAYWRRGDAPYVLHEPGERSYHPSMLKHGNSTKEKAFMSVYVWRGDVSTEHYSYSGRA